MSRPKLSRNGKLLLAVGAVLLLMWAGRKYQEYKLYHSPSERVPESPGVKAYMVRPRNLSGSLKRVGTIRSRAETNLQFGSPGRVETFSFEKGQFVKKGALVAQLGQAESRNMLAAAEAEYQKASSRYFRDRTIDRLEFERAKARYNQTRLEAAKTIVYAPHDGYLVEKWIQVGEHAEPTTPIGKLMDKSRVSIDIDLSEDDIQYLKVGQNVELSVDAVPDFKAMGLVASITPYLKGDTRSFGVKVELSKNPGEVLNPGMSARCTIRRYEKTGAIVLPVEAGAELANKKMRVFTVDDMNLVHARSLDILFMDEGQVEVSGIQVNERVVLNPGADLQDGSKVRLLSVFNPDSQTLPAVSASMGPTVP
jgi:membrane fusion protein (multidrug efflux system)